MQSIAGKGRMGDDTLAHVGTGELMIPPELQTPELLAMFSQIAMQAGLDPARYVVGTSKNSVNPETGKLEFWGGVGGNAEAGGMGVGGPSGSSGSAGGTGGGNQGGGYGHSGLSNAPDGLSGGYGQGGFATSGGGTSDGSGGQSEGGGMSRSPMVRAFQMGQPLAASMFAANSLINPMSTPIALIGMGLNALGATQGLNADGTTNSFGGRTGSGDSEGPDRMPLAKRMMKV